MECIYWGNWNKKQEVCLFLRFLELFWYPPLRVCLYLLRNRYCWHLFLQYKNYHTYSSQLLPKLQGVPDLLALQEHPCPSAHCDRNCEGHDSIHAVRLGHHYNCLSPLYFCSSWWKANQCHLHWLPDACVSSWLRWFLNWWLHFLGHSHLHPGCYHSPLSSTEYVDCYNGWHFWKSEGRIGEKRLPGNGRIGVSLRDRRLDSL